MIAFRARSAMFALALGSLAAGCSQPLDDLPRVPVAGTVTLDGQPMPEGVIQFFPAGDAKQERTAGANGEIKDGHFAIAREDGPVAGNYRVSISHVEVKDVAVKGQNKSIPSRNKKFGPEKIPARYNAKSELKADIGPKGADDLKYELQSK